MSPTAPCSAKTIQSPSETRRTETACKFLTGGQGGRYCYSNSWETLGFPNPSHTGKLEFSRPLSRSNLSPAIKIPRLRSGNFYCRVRMGGLEPPRVAPHGSKPCAFTNLATPARMASQYYICVLNNIQRSGNIYSSIIL